MITSREVDVYVNRYGVQAKVPVVQYDSGRRIIFRIVDATMPSNSTAYIFVRKPSGKCVYILSTVSGNTVTVNLTNQALAEYGINFGQVRVLKNEEVVTSFDIIFDVKQSYADSAIESQSGVTPAKLIDDIAVINARVDAFEALEDGSTTGDAELIDGRIGYNGTTYGSIGTAIRSQASSLDQRIRAIEESGVGDISAEDVSYDGSGSGLLATNVQDAIDEVASDSGSSSTADIPVAVKNAIYTLFSKAAYIETGLSDELAIVEDWASASTTCTISNRLTGCTTNNSATTIERGSRYSAVLTANSGYSFNTVKVTMGGVDITSTAYSSGTITIPSVTGNIVITAVAVRAVSSLSAVYTQSGTVYETAALSDLTADLVVTATYSDSSTAVIPSTDYTLSGTLAAGTSTITVSYGGKTATFNVTVTEYSTAPVIATENVVWSKTAPDTTTANGFGITQWYPYSFSQETLESSRYWDATNGYMTAAGWSGIKVCAPDWNTYNAGYSWPASANFKHVTGKDNVYLRYYSITRNALGTASFIRNSVSAVEDNCASFSIPLLDKDYSYAYWMPTNGNIIYPDGVSSGDIIFAGRYTPYYGLNNIMEAPDLSSISAVFTQGETVVTESTTLASLKTMLEVTALYDNGKTLPVNLGLVTLSGTLTEGTSTITATYENKTATFNVTVTAG